MPLYKYVANRLLTAVQNLLCGAKLSEYHTGYRAFSRRVLETLPLLETSEDFVFPSSTRRGGGWGRLPPGGVFLFQPLDTRAQRRFYDELSRSGGGGIWGLEKRFTPEIAVGSRSFARHFVRHLDAILHPDLHLLDLGCGTGITHPLIAPRCASITGAELSGGYARLARDNARRYGLKNVRVVVQDAASLAFPDASFDAALCLDVLHHVADLDATLAELERVVRPGGDVVVFEPNCMNPLLFLLCIFDRNERGALSRCWRGRYERRLARRFELVASAWNGLLIGPQGRLTTAIADFLVEGPLPRLLGRFGPEMFFHLRRRPDAS